MPTDEELLGAFARGDRHALGTLAERYEVPLLSLATAILSSQQEATDAIQETWLRVVRYAGSFNGASSAKTWLYRIAINQCRTLLSVRERVLPEGAGPDPPRADDPVGKAIEKDESERLRRAVEALPQPLRETVLLCYTHGLTHAEAAEAMGVPIGTVKSRTHGALEQLRARMKP
jgi:RNA polymerase sigma factor (sigma-70 family)